MQFPKLKEFMEKNNFSTESLIEVYKIIWVDENFVDESEFEKHNRDVIEVLHSYGFSLSWYASTEDGR